MATIKDVANLAEVSVATVSRYINNSGYVSEKTKKKIEYSINKLDYSPNEIARSLFQKKSKIIGILLPDLSNPFFSVLAQGAQEYASKYGYFLMIGSGIDSLKNESKFLHYLKNYNASGVLIASEKIKKYEGEIPAVMIDKKYDVDLSSVSVDNYSGGRIAAEQVLKGKAENILVMAGPQNIITSQKRLEGVLSGLKNKNVDVYQTESFKMERAKETAIDIIQNLSKNKFDTIIASNDIYAISLINELNKISYSIPDKIQIVGYDNISYSEFTAPALSTIDQPAYDMGYLGMKLLFEIINSDNQIRKDLVLKPKYIQRETLRSDNN